VGLEENKEAVRAFADAMSGGDPGVLDRILAPEARFQSAFAPDPLIGPAGAKGFLTTIRTGYPDLKVSIADMVAEGDLVAIRIENSGTNTGSMRGYEPTNKHAEFEEMFLFRFADGKIVEIRQIFNVLAMLRQIGMAPTEEEMKRLKKILPVLKGVGKVISVAGKLRPGRPKTA
jgi:steroid delta-isomerase-like uncharacterized protein